MLRKSLLSLIPLVATILINLVVAWVLLARLSDAAHAQLRELPFQSSVRRLSDHAERLTVQIQAAFVAGTTARIEAVVVAANEELKGFDGELKALRSDQSGMLERPIPGVPEGSTVCKMLDEVDAMRSDLAATVARASLLAGEELKRTELLTEQREALSKAARAVQGALVVDPKAANALQRGIMAVLYAQDQTTIMNIAGPQFHKGSEGLLEKLAEDAPERPLFVELNKAFDLVYATGRASIASRLDAQVLVDHGRAISLVALNHLLDAATQAVDERSRLIAKDSERARSLTVVAAGIGLVIGSLVAGILAWRTARVLMQCVGDLSLRAQSVAEVGAQLAETSPRLADGANSQAASLEESSAALQELSHLSQQAAGEARQVDLVAQDALSRATAGSLGARTAAERLGASLARLAAGMDGIAKASRQTAGVVKAIDDIAFQTNLIALNASVEAARAGDLGNGFAVVAEEVRNLAQRSSTEARATGELIEQNEVRLNEVLVLAAATQRELKAYLLEELPQVFGRLEGGAQTVVKRMAQLADTASQQASSVEQISNAVSEIDRSVQIAAQQSADLSQASERLSAENNHMLATLTDLERIAGR